MALIIKVVCDGSGCDKTLEITLTRAQQALGNPVESRLAKEGWVERTYCMKCQKNQKAQNVELRA